MPNTLEPPSECAPPNGVERIACGGDRDPRCAKILIVDDEPVNVIVARRYLHDFGYENVVATTNAAAALDLMRQEKPDAVLLDLMMPAVSGMEILGQVRRDLDLHDLPIIIVTALSDPHIRREAFELGATDFLTKPVDQAELVLRVRNTVLLKAHRDHLADYARRLEVEVRQRMSELIASRHEAQLQYLAGKAEIATDVLHNVGNVLQSVHVAAAIVRMSLDSPAWRSFDKAAELISEHAADLATFLTQNERGKLLPGYLVELFATLQQERAAAREETASLDKHLEHLSAVVATQQQYARPCTVVEPVSLPELVCDAEMLLDPSLARPATQVVHEFADVRPVKSHRQKLLQVLVNLLKNAHQAINALHDADEKGGLTVRIHQSQPDRVAIEIADNGVGVPPENLVRIFGHGFTTKKDGHGFGLHSCANLVKELGGAIHVHSAGDGRGATFTIELPAAGAAG